MKSTQSAVHDEQLKEEEAERPKVWRETPITNGLLFHGRDEAGRTGWFLRLVASGLYPRRVGPFRSKTQALEVLETFISEIEVHVLCDIHNALEFHQAYAVEGIPMLQGDHDSP